MKKISLAAMMLVVVAACVTGCAGMTPTVANFNEMDVNGDLVLTREEVVPVYGANEWRKMDIDGSGTVKQIEFHRYPNQHLSE